MIARWLIGGGVLILLMVVPLAGALYAQDVLEGQDSLDTNVPIEEGNGYIEESDLVGKRHTLYIVPFFEGAVGYATDVSVRDRRVYYLPGLDRNGVIIYPIGFPFIYEYRFHRNFSASLGFTIGFSTRRGFSVDGGSVHAGASFMENVVEGSSFYYEAGALMSLLIYRVEGFNGLFYGFIQQFQVGFRYSPKDSFLVLRLGGFVKGVFYSNTSLGVGVYWNFGIKF